VETDREDRGPASDVAPPLPGTVEAFMRLVEAGWDAEWPPAQGIHTVVVPVYVEQRAAALLWVRCSRRPNADT